MLSFRVLRFKTLSLHPMLFNHVLPSVTFVMALIKAQSVNLETPLLKCPWNKLSLWGSFLNNSSILMQITTIWVGEITQTSLGEIILNFILTKQAKLSLEKKLSSLKDAMANLANSEDQMVKSYAQFMNEIRTSLKNQSSQIRNLEASVGKIASMLSERR